MKIKRLLGAAVLAGWLSGAAAQGQQPDATPYPPPEPLAVHQGDEAPTPELVPASGGLSDWIVYKRDCCDGRPGKSTPFFTELYVDSGVSVPVGRDTSALAHVLVTGWSIAGGGRALFFNDTLTKAWVVDLHIINTNEGANRTDQSFPLTVAGPLSSTFTLKNLNRTMVGLGIGREWYLWKSADTEGCHWRAGADIGARYGTEYLSISTGLHLNDVIAGGYVAAHTDFEIPCHSIIFFVGARIEWAYTASDILQKNATTQLNSDMQDVNFLLTCGIRF